MQFHGYHCLDGNTRIKNVGSFKKYSKLNGLEIFSYEL